MPPRTAVVVPLFSWCTAQCPNDRSIFSPRVHYCEYPFISKVLWDWGVRQRWNLACLPFQSLCWCFIKVGSLVNKHCPRGEEIDVFLSSPFLQSLRQQWIPVQQLCQLGQLWWFFPSYCPWKLLHISTATTTPKALEGRKAWIMPHDCWSRVWSWSPLINLLRKIELLATLFNSSFCMSLLITGLCREEEEKVRRAGVGRGVRFIRKKGPLL